MQAQPVTADALESIREAAAWRLISLLLECPTEGWHDQVRALAAEVDQAELKQAAEMACDEASEGLYHTTFGPGGPAPPREVSYRNTLHPGRFLGELCSLYEAFAYDPQQHEAPDHVSVEAGFVGYLRLKEAYARSGGHDEQTAIAADVSACFVREHLANVAGPLAGLLENSGIRYLALAAQALAARVGVEPKAPGDEPSHPVE